VTVSVAQTMWYEENERSVSLYVSNYSCVVLSNTISYTHVVSVCEKGKIF